MLWRPPTSFHPCRHPCLQILTTICNWPSTILTVSVTTPISPTLTRRVGKEGGCWLRRLAGEIKGGLDASALP